MILYQKADGFLEQQKKNILAKNTVVVPYSDSCLLYIHIKVTWHAKTLGNDKEKIEKAWSYWDTVCVVSLVSWKNYLNNIIENVFFLLLFVIVLPPLGLNRLRWQMRTKFEPYLAGYMTLNLPWIESTLTWAERWAAYSL